MRICQNLMDVFFVLRESFMCAAVKMGYSVNLPIEGGG